MYPHKDGLAIAKTQLHNTSTFRVDGINFIENLSLDANKLASLIQSLKLPNWPVSLLLPAQQYQIRLVELPDVEDKDLLDAVKLKAADFINFPLDEAVVDLIHIPAKAFHGRRKMGYLIICQQQIIQHWHQCIGAAGLSLHAIDIEDMSLRNLAQRNTTKRQNGLVFFNKQSTQISLFYEHDLVLVRKIDIGSDSLIQNNELDAIQKDALILEVQRSFDYFQSQLGLGLVEHLSILAQSSDSDLLTNFIKENLNCSVTNLSNNTDYHDNKQVYCTLAIGAGLRYAEMQHEATS